MIIIIIIIIIIINAPYKQGASNRWYPGNCSCSGCSEISEQLSVLHRTPVVTVQL
jgi:hypothetical protein